MIGVGELAGEVSDPKKTYDLLTLTCVIEYNSHEICNVIAKMFIFEILLWSLFTSMESMHDQY